MRFREKTEMQTEIRELQRRVDSLHIPMVPQSIGFNPIKKDEGEVETPCKTPGRSVERTKNEHEFSWFDSQPVSNQPEHNSSTKVSSKVKTATYDGSTSWLDYKAHFETCAEINKWSYLEKRLYLAVSLRGQAQEVMGNLCTNSKDYGVLVKALEERFSPPNQADQLSINKLLSEQLYELCSVCFL